MKVQNAVAPQREQVKDFLALEGSAIMVSLLRFREKTAYPDGRDPDLSGRDAYERYATRASGIRVPAG